MQKKPQIGGFGASVIGIGSVRGADGYSVINGISDEG